MKRFTSIFSAIVLALTLQACGGGGGSDISIPAAPQRTDMQFGFFGRWGDVATETKSFTNLDFELLRDDVPTVISNMRLTGHSTVIDLSPRLLVPGSNPRQMLPLAEPGLRDFFDQLRAGGVLQQVRYISPGDEPNLRDDGTSQILPTEVALMRRVAADYPELAGVKVGVIYAGNKPMPSIGMVDVAGFDDYDASILATWRKPLGSY
jgi:hypothetical protein